MSSGEDGHGTLDTNVGFVTRPLPTLPSDLVESEPDAGPSWGLIIPIIMIVAFLLCVVLCLYWHKWRDKRTLHIQQPNGATSFHRSYLGPNSSLNRGSGSIRDSTRSTTPLRNSINEKVSSTHVIPALPAPGGKFNYVWDQNQMRAYALSASTSSARRLSSRPLSPIDEIDSPISAEGGLSEFSNTYEINPQASFSPYHLTWITQSQSNPPPSYEQSANSSAANWSNGTKRRRSAPAAVENGPFCGYQPRVNSPFYPNNNTPTTECEPDSEGDGYHSRNTTTNQSSQFTSYPSSPGRSTNRLSITTDTDRHSSSMGTSHQESNSMCNQVESVQPLAWNNHADNPSVMSLPSSIMKYHQTVTDDPNNNSLLVPGSYLPNPLPKGMNYTLASSVTSSDTNYSDNTSMLPNVGSNNTTGFPNSRSYPASIERSGTVSPEDLSKLVEEMSSIRPIDEMSSIRPNSSADRHSRVISLSGHNASADLHRSWSVVADIDISSLSPKAASSKLNQTDASCSWDSYPLNLKSTSRSFPDLPLHIQGIENSLTHPNLHNLSRMKLKKAMLVDKQYWV